MEFEKLQTYLDKSMALKAAANLLDWDSQTGAPKAGDEYTEKIIGSLSELQREVMEQKEVYDIVGKLTQKKELTQAEKAILREVGKELELYHKVPKEVSKKTAALCTRATFCWEKAKEKEKLENFIPALKEVVENKKEIAKARAGRKKKPYDMLLSDYEEIFDIERLDEFFEKLKKNILPMIAKHSSEKKKQKGDNREQNVFTRETEEYPIERQKEFCKWLSAYIGFDFNRGMTGESPHPFTTNLHNHDVRWSDHYNKNYLLSGIFSALHESGHGIYEQNIKNEYTLTYIGGGASAAMHEAQARFFENYMGRQKSFWKSVYPKLKEFFPQQTKGVSLEEFTEQLRLVSPGAIRTEADELTYPMHIIIRYELEKELFDNQIEVEELADVWKEKYKKYLGITIQSDREGILQDIHWAGGQFGYFPSYNIGNAIAAQMYYHIKSVMPWDSYLEEGTITPIRVYLNEKIQQYGMLKNTDELLKEMTGEELNTDYYIQYLKEFY